jgi:hypothetical protein
LAVALAACGSTSKSPDASATAPLPADYIPLPPGQGPRYRLPAVSPAVAGRRPVAGLTCRRTGGRRVFGIHLELYAHRRVLPVPAGIGIAPPQVRQGAYVRAGACVYPLRTYEPTGVVVVDAGPTSYALGTLFAVWGQPLAANRLAGFRGPVRAFVGGARWRGPVTAIPLTRHTEIVLEVGAPVLPHRTYLFPPGL